MKKFKLKFLMVRLFLLVIVIPSVSIGLPASTHPATGREGQLTVYSELQLVQSLD